MGLPRRAIIIKVKLDTQKLESENKKEYETIELVRDDSKIEIEKIARLRENMKETSLRVMLYKKLNA